jgi:perosamine synthetase
MGRAYTERLGRLTGLTVPVEEPWARNVYWMYGVMVDEALGMDAAELARRLAARGVMTRPFFLGLHAQPALRERGWFAGDDYPVADRLARQGLYLPSGLALTAAQLDAVCAALEAEWSRLPV